MYESYGLEDSKFKIKVNKEFELWEKGEGPRGRAATGTTQLAGPAWG